MEEHLRGGNMTFVSRDLVVRLAAAGDAAGLRRLADGDAEEYDDDVAHVVRARAILDGAL